MNIYTQLSTMGLCNSYIIFRKKSRSAILVDPGTVDAELIDLINKHKLNITDVLITHSHSDHTKGLGTLLKIWDANVYAMRPFIGNIPTKTIQDDESILCADIEIDIISVPGHSMDSAVFRIGNSLFTGDTLYCGTIAHTNTLIEKRLLIKSIREKIMCHADNYLVFPGHGPISKLRIERMFNHDLLESFAVQL